MINFYTVCIFLVIYLICSVNPAIIICKKKTGEDIRKLGSGNAGSANAMRVLGRLLGLVVVILDIAKVFVILYIAIFISKLFNHEIDVTFKTIFILASVIGHCFPVYYGFRGGKGVIVGITVMAILEPQTAIICVISGLIVMLFTRTVAIGTLSGLVLYVIIALVTGHDYLTAVIISSLIIMFKHRQSIQRILTKQEHKF